MIDRATLLLHAAGALDPAESARVEAWLTEHPGALPDLEALPAETERWRLPPPGLGLGVAAGMPAVMGPNRLRAGDRFQMRLAPRSDAAQRLVVVLRRLAGPWQVLSPAAADQRLLLTDLPVEADGRHRLDLVVRPPAGRQRIAVALPPADLPIDWQGSDPWSALLQGLDQGSVPAGSTELLVS